MSLDMKIEKSTDSKKSVSEELLDAYLKKAVKLTEYKGPLTSNIALSKEAKKEEWQEIKPEDVQKRQETHDAVVKEAEEKMATKVKVGYALGMNTKLAGSAVIASVLSTMPVVVGTAAACAIASVNHGLPEGFLSAAGVANAVVVGTAVFGCQCAENTFSNYVDVKHTQMALKKLAKSLEKQEAKEKEAGKGVKAAVIAKAGYAR